MIDTDILRGAKNLLTGCGELKSGDRLLVLFEDAALGFYDSAIVDAVLAAAQSLGIAAQSEQIPYSPTATDPTPDLLARMKAVDRVLFLARTGDQIRFRPALGNIRPIVSYALDGGMLASSFGRTDHNALIKLTRIIHQTPGISFRRTGSAGLTAAF
ncbi:MAG: hypothetical protein Q9M48_07940 [Rhodobacterales bacterium]|nr:hypothetical protein [Rhodobacterales bacterium]